MKTAEELVKTHSGAVERRREIILALCNGAHIIQPVDIDPVWTGHLLVRVANVIIEETEQ